MRRLQRRLLLLAPLVGLLLLSCLDRGDRPPSARKLRSLLNPVLESECSSSVCIDLRVRENRARTVGGRNLLAALEVGWVEVPDGMSPETFEELPIGHHFELSAKGRNHLVDRACSYSDMGMTPLRYRDTYGSPDHWVRLRVRRRVVSSILKIAGPWDWNGDQWIRVFYDAEVSEVTELGKRLGYPKTAPPYLSGPGAQTAILRLYEGKWRLAQRG